MLQEYSKETVIEEKIGRATDGDGFRGRMIKSPYIQAQRINADLMSNGFNQPVNLPEGLDGMVSTMIPKPGSA